MTDLEIEERLAETSVIYIINPGIKEIKRLRKYYSVEIISKDQIKITYK